MAEKISAPAVVRKNKHIQIQTAIPHESGLVFHPDFFSSVSASSVFPDVALHELKAQGVPVIDPDRKLIDLKKITTAGGLTGGGGKAAGSEAEANARYAEDALNNGYGEHRAISVILNTPQPLPEPLWSAFNFRQKPSYDLHTYPIPRDASGEPLTYKDLYLAYENDEEWQKEQLQLLRRAGKAIVLTHFWHGRLMQEITQEARNEGLDVMTLARNHSIDLVTVEKQDPEYFTDNYLDPDNRELTTFRMQKEKENAVLADFNVFTTEEEARAAADAHDGIDGFTKESFLDKAIVLPIVVETDKYHPEPEYKKHIREQAFERHLKPLGALPEDEYWGCFVRRDWKEKGLDILLEGYVEWMIAKGQQGADRLPNLVIAGGLNSKPGNSTMERWADDLIASLPQWLRRKIFNIKYAIPNEEAYALKSVAIYCSPEETLGIAQIEDRAGGVPVILNQNAMGHRIHPQDGTVFFDHHSPGSLHQAFEQMLDSNIRRAVANAGIDMSQQFSPQAVTYSLFSQLREKNSDFFSQ